MRILRGVVLVALALGAVGVAGPARGQDTRVLVFNGEANRLNAYDAATGAKQTVIHSADDAEDGSHTSPSPPRDINAQICFFPDGSRRFIAGEDTGQGSGGVDGQPGWGIFQLKGDKVGELSAEQVGKLKPTFQTSDNAEENEPYESNPENYGCGFLSDGRVLTGDVGNQYPLTPNNGQLIVWFPDPVKGFNSFDLKYCKIDIEIPTSGGIYVDEQDRIYIASNRPGSPDASRFGGIYRYTGPFPTSDTPEGGCDSKDGTGAPMTTKVEAEQFITAQPVVGLATPSAIVSNGKGGFYVSSVFDGRIAEFDGEGEFQRFILQPGPGEVPPYAHGTPFGIGLGPDGTLYYANLGILLAVPGPGLGTVERIRFVNGEPQTPEIMDADLEFPDGIGVLVVADDAAVAAPPPPPAAKAAGASQERQGSGLPATGGAGFGLVGLFALAAALAVRPVLCRFRALTAP